MSTVIDTSPGDEPLAAIRAPLMDALLAMDAWVRERPDAGFGVDWYAPVDPVHYPDAYWAFGRGFAHLYRVLGREEHLRAAVRCGDWLWEHRFAGYRNASWGLPWAYTAPATMSYLVITAGVGSLFLALADVQPERAGEWTARAESAFAWIRDESGGIRQGDALLLFYGPHQTVRYPVYNAAAEACSFVSLLAQRTDDRELATWAASVARGVIRAQRTDGAWPYSVRSAHVDNVHTGMTLDGLWLASERLPSELTAGWERCLQAGTRFYAARLFGPDGAGVERLLTRVRDLPATPWRRWMADRLSTAGLLRRRVPETRLWGYAAGVRAFTAAGEHDPVWLTTAARIASFVIRSHRLAAGGYAFRRDHPRDFVRHQGWWFHAMARLAARLASPPLHPAGAGGD